MFSLAFAPFAMLALWPFLAAADVFAGDGKSCMKSALASTMTRSFEACQLYSDAQDYQQVLAERDSCFAERDALHTALHTATKEEFLVLMTFGESIGLVMLDEANYESLVSGINEEFVE